MLCFVLPPLSCFHFSHLSSPSSVLSPKAKLMKRHPSFSDLLLLFISESLSANQCLSCLSASCPRGPPTGSWQWRSDGCCETWLLYWLQRALQQLVHWNKAQCVIAKDVLWRSENMWESVNVSQGFPSRDLFIILPDGCRNRFGGCGWGREARGGGAGGRIWRTQIANSGSGAVPWNTRLSLRIRARSASLKACFWSVLQTLCYNVLDLIQHKHYVLVSCYEIQ